MNVRILFITNRDDISIEYLISKLRLKTLDYLRINSEDIDKIHFEIKPSGYSALVINNVSYSIRNTQSVVFKRTPIKFESNPQDIDTPYLNNEKKHFLEGLYLSLTEAKWINPMFATHIAERKLFQLKIAERIGLEIPKYVFTNNPVVATNFLQKNVKSIIKPISNGLQVVGDNIYSIYTSEIEKDYFKSFDNKILFETPVFLQELIPNKADIRVVVIGRKIFAIKIEKDNPHEVDWRKPEINKKYTLIELPPRLNNLLIKLNEYFNLVYSAIDLIEKPNGDYIFLEINPVGEWVWLEHELGIDVSGEFIKELLWEN